ncbi:hypothetical protein GIB67_023111 [Kingdonia uniflora]|uniref:MSP domain-containing protein n=1 Tax=Kingdonia uniflora TaxID=39325 RepID=A0A7J7M5K8_9MAGN|nr:hypothetical protein GIB67_023111 [Kingdonia uniflora]
MNRLISLEPSNLVAIRVDQAQKCHGELTLRNVMYTMPVAFRLHPVNKSRYIIRPQSGILSPISTLNVEITYLFPPPLGPMSLPDSFPYSNDAFLLHSVVVPGAAVKDTSPFYDNVPNDWFTNKKKQVFIDSGVKVVFVGARILCRLVADGAMDEIREVLERSNPEWRAVDSVDSYGQTLLHLAVAQSRADLVQILLEFDPNVDSRNRSGRTALDSAAESGETLIVELLLARGASTERSESCTIGAIHLAAGGGHVEVVKLLLLKGADVNSVTRDGRTALHLAIEERTIGCIKLLLARGARADVPNTTDGNTPLHLAAGFGDEQMVKLLLVKGANKDVRNRTGKTAYDIAAEYGHIRLYDALCLGDKLWDASRKGELQNIHRFLESGALINGRDQHGWTALHRTALKGHVDVARVLIHKGIDVNAKDEEGYTALHCGTESGHAEVIDLLLKKGADVEAKTNKGVTALEIANLYQYAGIIRILVQGGAIVDSVTHTGSDVKVKWVESGKLKNQPGLLKFRTSALVQEQDMGSMKKKTSKGRDVSHSSFRRSIPLAVL